MNDSTVYPPDRLHAIMAGSGNPFGVMTPMAKRLIRALHDGMDVASAAQRLEISEREAHEILDKLEEVSLIEKRGDTVALRFFVASETEVASCLKLAHDVGRLLADHLLGQWSELRKLYDRMAISRDAPLESRSFLLVGDFILDVGLLEALARDANLMPAAPHRPSLDSPDARYYFWMIEGAHDQLGRYGQRSIDLPWPASQHVSFGEYWIDGEPNTSRNQLYRTIKRMLDEKQVSSPEELSQSVGSLFIGEADSQLWWDNTREAADGLVSVYRSQESRLREFYLQTVASSSPGTSFAEFFCWFDHVAYAAAIDSLEEADVLTIPDSRYVAAVMYPGESNAY